MIQKGENKKMLVKATEKYKKLNIKDDELKRVPEIGEKWEVSEERYKILTETNKFNVKFVEKVEEIETSSKKIKAETAIKKTRKRSK